MNWPQSTFAPNSEPLVAVACAWYNRSQHIHDTLQSLLAQQFESFEIILINDGSDDPCVREILDSYTDPRLRVIHQENAGFVQAIRRAIEASRAPFIAIQGAGDISFPNRLKMQADYLLAHPKCVGVSVRREKVFVGTALEEKRLESGVPAHQITQVDLLKKPNPFTHGEVMFRRDIYQKVGGYRDFFRFAQDRDLWLRMSRHGYFSLMNHVLYKKKQFQEDGISASAKKIILQLKLSHFAKTAEEYHQHFNVDLIDVFGVHAGLFRGRSNRVARALTGFSLRYFCAGDNPSARVLAQASLDERFTIRGACWYVCLKASCRALAVERILKRVLRGRIGTSDLVYTSLVRGEGK